MLFLDSDVFSLMPCIICCGKSVIGGLLEGMGVDRSDHRKVSRRRRTPTLSFRLDYEI